ncbi:hypothetical protein CRM22_005482 [Opisthorchis felineus]|uniref:Ubiquitin-like-conjugating enzyme ATG3 n=1 Tax=Opisthorchis felineus TaxID=147828 RepID=A0A4S2LQU0_OPIFE|nr:hypothetical protein CRM22_005482 [Opisthorchis felineus]
MDSIRQAVTRTALGLAEYVVPVLRTSKFKETGVITPDEFVAAGDFLVHHCPTWQWMTGDKPPRDYLPVTKQYLLTRNVPCYKRVKQVDNHNEDLEETVEGGWVDTHHYASAYTEDTDKPAEMPTDQRGIASAHIGDNAVGLDEEEDEEEEAEDMEAFMQRGMLDEVDPISVCPSITKLHNLASDPDTIVSTRTYDLYITYDKYYQTPRMWLYGYNEHGDPLTADEMYEDFSQDHAKKTVTMEQNPHLSGPPMPSIHPCRQADVMKKLIAIVADGGAELAVHQYMMVFLKFVQAVIPTIEYDYTHNFNMS